MQFTIVHNNYNVLDLKKSMEFYEKAFGLTEKRRIAPEDGSFIIVYVGNENAPHLVELTWLRDRKEPYNLGDNEIHLALRVDDFEAAHKLHEEMGCICFENKKMGIYFVTDPDGYWIEVVPTR